MEALFLKLVNLSLTAGWLILAVLLLRLIFRRAPRWIFCLLWGLAALRLVCPISLKSALSLIPSAETVPTSLTQPRRRSTAGLPRSIRRSIPSYPKTSRRRRKTV